MASEMDDIVCALQPDPKPAVDPDAPFRWAVVEIFGHRRHAGRCRQEEMFGAKMLRIDVPIKGDPASHGWETHFYGGSAIFSFSLTTEDVVMRANRPYEAPAINRLNRLTYEEPDGDDDREPF